MKMMKTKPVETRYYTAAMAMVVAIHCNNVGADLLEARRCGEALAILRTAAKLLHPISKIIKDRQEEDDFGNDQALLLVHEDFQMIGQIKLILDGLRESLSSSTDNNNSDDDDDQEHNGDDHWQESHSSQEPPRRTRSMVEKDSFMCLDAIRIQDIINRETTYNDLKACTINSAIIVHNMGLSFALGGTEQCLYKATCLFDMCFHLVTSEGESHVTCLTYTNLCMAALNNSGRIHYSLGNFTVSGQYFSQLSSFILSLPLVSDPATVKRRNDFLLNTLLLREPYSACAA